MSQWALCWWMSIPVRSSNTSHPDNFTTSGQRKNTVTRPLFKCRTIDTLASMKSPNCIVFVATENYCLSVFFWVDFFTTGC